MWCALTDVREFNQWFGVALTTPFAPGAVVSGRITIPASEHVTAPTCAATWNGRRRWMPNEPPRRPRQGERRDDALGGRLWGALGVVAPEVVGAPRQPAGRVEPIPDVHAQQVAARRLQVALDRLLGEAERRRVPLEVHRLRRLELAEVRGAAPMAEDVVLRHPFGGVGKPEPLKHLGGNVWSRRITEADRLVYEVFDDRGEFLRARYHC